MKRSFLQLHIAILLAGFTGVLGRLITLDEGILVWYRMGFSALALMILAVGHGRMALPRRRPLLQLLGVGGIVSLHWVFFYGSVKYANVSIALVCFSSVGFFTAILDPLISGRRFLLRELALGIAVMLGIWLIFRFDASFRMGILLGTVSSLLAALFTILNKLLLKRHAAEVVSLWEMTGGWLLLSLLLPGWLSIFPETRLLPSLPDLWWLLFLSLVCTVLAFRLSLDALRRISPFTLNLSYNLEPVYGIMLAFLLYQENRYLGKGFLLGFSIIMATVVVQSILVWLETRESKRKL